MHGYKTLTFYFDQGVGRLVMDQPPQNLMSLLFFEELAQLAEEINAMRDLRALVIYGRGRHYSSGANLDELLGIFANGNQDPRTGIRIDLERFLDRNYKTFLLLDSLKIPVISAIRGACLGSAFELALFSHFRFCGEDAVFGLPESSFQLMPGLGGISKMAAIAGKSTAIELSLRGNTFPAETALDLKLVDRILPRKQVVESSVAFARSVMVDYKREKSILYLKKFNPAYAPA